MVPQGILRIRPAGDPACLPRRVSHFECAAVELLADMRVGSERIERRMKDGLRRWFRLRSNLCLWVIPLASLFGGCGHLARVDPWERDVLARTDMTLDSEGVDLELDDHLYFSREATAGGRSFGGGGCGCN